MFRVLFDIATYCGRDGLVECVSPRQCRICQSFREQARSHI